MDTKWPAMHDGAATGSMPTSSAATRFASFKAPSPAKKKDYNVFGAQFVVVALVVILLRPSFAVRRQSELDLPRLNMTVVFACAALSVGASVVLLRMRLV